MTAKKTTTAVTTKTTKLTALQEAKEKAVDNLKTVEAALRAEEVRVAKVMRKTHIAMILKDFETKHGFFVKKTDHKKVSLPKKELEIINAVKDGSWGCQTENVHRLISILTDIPLTEFGNDKREVDADFGKTYPGMFAVPTCNENSHNYTVGSVVFAVNCDSESHMKALSEKHFDGHGNNLITRESGLRRPTKDELEAFLTNVPFKTFERIKKGLKIQ